jgi:hypothetical protein
LATPGGRNLRGLPVSPNFCGWQITCLRPVDPNRVATMYQLHVFPITFYLWRWEVRCGGALRRCGTARTKGTVQRKVSEIGYN